jgi:hypothetical protein
MYAFSVSFSSSDLRRRCHETVSDIEKQGG